MYGERLFRRPKNLILERDQRFLPQFYHKWIKIMLIRDSVVFVTMNTKYKTYR